MSAYIKYFRGHLNGYYFDVRGTVKLLEDAHHFKIGLQRKVDATSVLKKTAILALGLVRSMYLIILPRVVERSKMTKTCEDTVDDLVAPPLYLANGLNNRNDYATIVMRLDRMTHHDVYIRETVCEK